MEFLGAENTKKHWTIKVASYCPKKNPNTRPFAEVSAHTPIVDSNGGPNLCKRVHQNWHSTPYF